MSQRNSEDGRKVSQVDLYSRESLIVNPIVDVSGQKGQKLFFICSILKDIRSLADVSDHPGRERIAMFPLTF